MPTKRCGIAAARMALMAVPRLPSVPFLNPTGIDRPEAISRWVCDSVVRAPIADQLNKSPVLRAVRIQRFGSQRQAHAHQIQQQATRDMQACFNVKRTVHVRIVD